MTCLCAREIFSPKKDKQAWNCVDNLVILYYWTLAKFKVLSTFIILAFLSKLADIADMAWKSFFLDESPKILVISKFQCAQFWKLNLKLKKRPFYVVIGTWQIRKMEWVQMQDISSKIKGILMPKAKIWIFVSSYLNNVF